MNEELSSRDIAKRNGPPGWPNWIGRPEQCTNVNGSIRCAGHKDEHPDLVHYALLRGAVDRTWPVL